MKMGKFIKVGLATTLICIFGVFALASGGESTTTDQGTQAVGESSENNQNTENGSNLGDYNVEIKGCRLAKDYEGKNVVIIKYGFTNNSENPASFSFALDDAVYQNGIGLNNAFVLNDSAKYNSDDQIKEIKKGTTLDVEVAYELNDITTDIEVEVKELISFNDSIVKKTFKIAQ